MMKSLAQSLVLTLCSSAAWGALTVGSPVADKCFDSIGGKKVCWHDSSPKWRVLIYTAGWCPGCQQLMKDLVPKLASYSKQPVEFIVQLVDGFNYNDGVNEKTLGEYAARYQYTGVIVASPKDAGKEFFDPPRYIPSVVIIDTTDQLNFTAVGPEADEITAHLDSVLPPT